MDAQSQRDRLHRLLQQTPAIINFLKGSDLVFEFVHPAAAEKTGGRAVVGKPLLEALPEFKDQPYVDLLLKVLRTGEPESGNEVPVVHENQSGRRETSYWNFIYLPTRDAEGHVEGVMTFDFEVTAQVLARHRVEKLAVELRDSEEQFRTLANSIPQLAWIAEADGSIHWYNRRWYDYTGTTPKQMEEQSGWGWQRVHDPAELPRVVARFRDAVVSGDPWEDTFPLRRHDGQFRWFLSRAMPLRDSSGRIVRWFGTNTDVEEQRRMAAELREALQARDDFISIAGHELRTPLTAMLLQINNVTRLARKEGAPPVLTERLEKANAAGLKLQTLVDQLLDVSRLQSGRLVLELESVDLVALSRDVVSRYLESGTPLSVEAAEQVVGTWDRGRLDQVLTNLISNAIKYGEGKPVELRVSRVDDLAPVRTWPDARAGCSFDVALRYGTSAVASLVVEIDATRAAPFPCTLARRGFPQRRTCPTPAVE
jgi:PAS domain S-box-containing protein